MKMLWLWFYFRFLTAILFAVISILSAFAGIFSLFVPDKCLMLLYMFVSKYHNAVISSETKPFEERKDKFSIEIRIAKWKKSDRKRYFQSLN